MTLLMSAAILGLAWFAAVNAIGSLVVWSLSRLIANRIVPDPRRSRWLLAVRFLPVAAATALSVALFIPAHLQLEPVEPDERYGMLLLAFAAAGLLLFCNSALRVWSVILVARRLLEATHAGVHHRTRGWTELPWMHGIALVGVFRPRVVVGTQISRVLTGGELDVAIGHELAHYDARDNLTRVLIFCAPDFFGFTPAARRIERLWDAQAECLADARAVRGSPGRAKRLASALVKVARLRASEADSSVAWSLFHREALLEMRVRQLIDVHPAYIQSPHRRATMSLWVAAAIASAWVAGLPSALHRFTELLVARLP